MVCPISGYANMNTEIVGLFLADLAEKVIDLRVSLSKQGTAHRSRGMRAVWLSPPPNHQVDIG